MGSRERMRLVFKCVKEGLGRLLFETRLRTGALILPGETEARLCRTWIDGSGMRTSRWV